MMGVPEVAEGICSRFDHVLVDEYQDTNRLQALVLTRMKPDSRGVTVVGDDAPSIYSFGSRGSAQHFRVPEDFAFAGFGTVLKASPGQST